VANAHHRRGSHAPAPRRVSTENAERRLERQSPEKYAAWALDAITPLALHAADMDVAVAGGKTLRLHTSVCMTRPVTRESLPRV